ncbi:MAG: prohibitin family protein [Gammaproteobacteria bacterium]|nr:prohibitin family protein [Gammaproteobacteria bacterium]
MYKQIIAGVIGVVVLGLLWSSWVIVESGHVGVVRFLGAVEPVALEEGFHMKIPFAEDVVQLDVRLRKAENDATAASKDLQVVSTQVAVQYSLTGDVMPLTFQRIGARAVTVESNVIYPAIMESVKSITAQYTAEELVTRRAEVKIQIQDAIAANIETTLSQKGAAGAVELANVAITDFEFSAEFNRAIEEKVRAEQEALKAENEKLRRVTQAEAAAAERTLAADAEAYQIEVASVAKAEAIRREAEALRDNPDLIQLRLAEKWDGQLPQFTGGDAIPLLNVDALRGN